MSYCPDCKEPLTSSTGWFRWCDICGYKELMHTSPATARDILALLDAEIAYWAKFHAGPEPLSRPRFSSREIVYRLRKITKAIKEL